MAILRWLSYLPHRIVQLFMGVYPLPAIRLARPVLGHETAPAWLGPFLSSSTWFGRLWWTLFGYVILTGALTVCGFAAAGLLYLGVVIFNLGSAVLSGGSVGANLFDLTLSKDTLGRLGMLIAYLAGVFFPREYQRIAPATFGVLRSLLKVRRSIVRVIYRVGRFIIRVFGYVFLLGLSLLPLASLLMVLPAVLPQETVLTDSIRPARSFWRRFGRRVFALLTGFALLVGLLAIAVEIVTRMNLKGTYFGELARLILPTDLANALPRAMVEQWPYVLLIMYATDLAVLFAIGKVPLQYNIRNLAVRWKVTILTGLTFTVVVGLLTGMFAFVNGINQLTSNSGIPGNVFVLSDGATDELFSNMGYGDVDKVELEKVYYDRAGNLLPKPIAIKELPAPDGRGMVRLMSRETYFVINQAVPVKKGEKPRRRFVQLRGIRDPFVAAKVHDIRLVEGDWIKGSGVLDIGGGRTAWQAVIGEGAAANFGADQGKERLHAGDLFELGDKQMLVTGIMKSEGSTFGSEVWALQQLVGPQFGKQQFTTLVLRVEDDTLASAEEMSWHLRNRFKNPRLKAVSETEYFRDLGKSN